MREWMASTGFIFPRTVKELLRFRKLYNGVEINLDGCRVDAEKILGRKSSNQTFPSPPIAIPQPIHLRMAARKGDSTIPQHILDKIKKNQDQRKNDDDSSTQKKS